MHSLFKMTAVAIFLAAVPFCEAMDTRNFLSENLRELLTKADTEAFLVVSGDPLGISNGCTPFYTICTDFKEDPKGNFVNSEGKYLQIFKTLDTGYVQVADQMTTVEMITASSRDLLCCSVVASTGVTLMNINLSACAPIGTVITLPFDVLDSLGVSHTINFNFNKLYVNPDSWVVYSQCVDATFDAIYTAGVPIVFDSYGNLASINGSDIQIFNNAPQMIINWNNAASISCLSIDFGMLHTSRGLRAIGMKPDVSTPVVVNGAIRTYLRSTVNPKTGNFFAKFSDGSELIYGKVPVITFQIPKINLY